tara:strand:- start:18 stop:146 length:129 start_codon:yes stop_codon:yes gene_type:complete
MIKETIILILAPIIFYLFLVYQDKKNKKEIKQQERLNEIKTK